MPAIAFPRAASLDVCESAETDEARPVNDDTPAAETTATRQGPEGPSDETLLARVARDRDRAAFVALFHRYAGRIKGFLIRTGADPGLAEEAAQEVMVTLWRRAETFDPDRAAATTWIFTLVRNKRIDFLRRAGRTGGEVAGGEFQPEPVPSAESELAGTERDALVREALSTLTEDQREAVRLSFFAGLSHGDIARDLGVPVGTVKSRLRLAFARLRARLGPDFARELHDD